MRTLKIYLFGCPQVAYDGEGYGKVRLTRAIQLLLAYLLINRHRMHSREVLAGLFWSDYSQEKARGCLNTALWRLRRALEPSDIPNGTYLVSNTSGEIGFNPESSYWLDVAIFEELIEKNMNRSINLIDSTNVQEIENALEQGHATILAAIKARSRARAERAMAAHLNDSRKHLLAAIKARSKAKAERDGILHPDGSRSEAHEAGM